MTSVSLTDLKAKRAAMTQGRWARGKWYWASPDVSTWRDTPKELLPDPECRGHIVTADHEGEVVTGCGCCGSPDATDEDATGIVATHNAADVLIAAVEAAIAYRDAECTGKRCSHPAHRSPCAIIAADDALSAALAKIKP